MLFNSNMFYVQEVLIYICTYTHLITHNMDLSLNQFIQTGFKKTFSNQSLNKSKALCNTLLEASRRLQLQPKKTKTWFFFFLKELKRADLQEDIIVSLDDNQCQCRKKKGLLAWELPASIQTWIYTSHPQAHVSEFCKQSKTLSSTCLQKTRTETQAK